jgi:hypothetical protein
MGYCELDPPNANMCFGENLVQGQPCSLATECASGFCADGFCCDTACDGFCEACADALTPLPNGACALIDANVDENGPVACNGVMSCDGLGNCKKDNGQICGVASECSSGACVEGFCCNTACTTPCRSCSATLTASPNGVCAIIETAFTDDLVPAGACTGNMTCDAAGNCKKDLGQGCANAGECATGFCVDGVCCEALCDPLCMACSNAKTQQASGQCENVPMMTDPDEECTNPNDLQCCNGFGACGGFDPACDI